jgi:hypothetical protein
MADVLALHRSVRSDFTKPRLDKGMQAKWSYTALRGDGGAYKLTR